MRMTRRGGDQVLIDYRHAGRHVRRVVGLDALTEFLGGAAIQESNLGSKGVMTFSRFCEDWFLAKHAKLRLKDNTFQRVKEGVRVLNKHFGGKDLHKIQRSDWENYKALRFAGKYSAKGKHISEGTVKKEFQLFRSVLAYAVEIGHIRRNILEGVKSGLTDGCRADIWLTKAEISLFINRIPDKFKTFRDLFEFRVWTGARPEEAASFGRENINPEMEEIWLNTGKKRKKDAGIVHKRYFKIKSLGPRFEVLLKSLTPHPGSGLFFCNPETGKPYTSRYTLKVFGTVMQATGIKKRLPVTPYDLRGTFCTHRAMIVKSFRQLQTEMGHLSPQSIEHYLAAASHHQPEESIFFGIPTPEPK